MKPTPLEIAFILAAFAVLCLGIAVILTPETLSYDEFLRRF